MRILGINALFHDPAAALAIDGRTVAAAEEERFSRRKHGKRPLPFSAWELPEKAAAWCLKRAGLRPQDLDAVACSFDPSLARPADAMGLDDPWDHLRLTCAREAAVPFERPPDIAATVARELAGNGIVAWFQGRAEYGPRALGHRSLLTHPGHAGNLERLSDVKGREQFRPVAPMVLDDRAAEIFDGPPPSPYMLFVHDVAPAWRERIPAVVHVDGTARIQTVDPAREPLVAEMPGEFERLTGLPVVVDTSLNTAGQPVADDSRDALECFGSSPAALLAIGPYAIRRGGFFHSPAGGEGEVLR